MITVLASCMVSLCVAAQTQPITKEQVRSPEALRMAAIADTMMVDKKAIANDKDEKKKKSRRERSHKECSRMKS